MSNKVTEEQQEKPYYKRLEWYFEKFAPVVIGVMVVVVSNIIIPERNVVIWIISGVSYILMVVVFAAVCGFVTRHYNEKHGAPAACKLAMDENCEKMNELHNQYCEECQNAIAQMNSKVSEQQEYFQKVDRLVNNAKKLEQMYLDAVEKRLRTNKQVAEIEANAKRNSEIFIMTSSCLLERYNSDMRESIANNIIRGVKYRYIIPDSKENEYKQMVYAVMAEIQHICEVQNKSFDLDGGNDFIKAVRLKDEYCLLTIAYYELEDPELSTVIVKLPADTMAEVYEEEALTYLVPKGELMKNGTKKYYHEHSVFLQNMTRIYQSQKEEEKTWVLTKSELMKCYPNGVEISENPKVTVILDQGW